MRALAAALALAVAPYALACDALRPVTLDYEVERGDTYLGDGQIALRAEPPPGCYVYRRTAEPRLLLRLLTGPLEEQSRFCLVDGTFRSQHYFFQRDGAEDENYRLDFNWGADKVFGGDFGSLALSEYRSDPLALQLRVRNWICRSLNRGEGVPEGSIEVGFVDQDGKDAYRFAVTERTRVKVPAGTFDTLRVERVDPSKRSTRFWIAPELDYQVVKAEQLKRGDPTIRLKLKKPPRFDGG